MRKERFEFGRNWRRFLRSLTPEKVANAESSLRDFLAPHLIEGRTFLDIGCGSGLFSYAAWRLKAGKVLSFDIDPLSVDCARRLHERAGRPSNWLVLEGSILERKFLEKLGRFDIVYSWGVLHHTGDMWKALDNACDLVASKGLLYIALYNRVEGIKGSETWLKIKKFYNSASWPVKKAIELAYFLRFMLVSLAGARNPLREILNYESHRGMDWWTDMRDWLGGLPYEYATIEEVFTYMKRRQPDFELINIKSVNSLANNWFLFKKRS